MAGPEERFVSEAFVKVAKVIAEGRLRNSKNAHDRHEAFHLFTNNVPEVEADLRKWWSTHASPLFFTIAIEKADKAGKLPTQGCRMESTANLENNYEILECWRLLYEKKRSGGGEAEPVWVKRLILLMRSICTVLRLLPCHRLVTQLRGSSERETMVKYFITHGERAQAPRIIEAESVYRFGVVDTLNGRFCVDVRYRDQNLEFPHLFPELPININPLYMAIPPAAAGPSRTPSLARERSKSEADVPLDLDAIVVPMSPPIGTSRQNHPYGTSAPPVSGIALALGPGGGLPQHSPRSGGMTPRASLERRGSTSAAEGLGSRPVDIPSHRSSRTGSDPPAPGSLGSTGGSSGSRRRFYSGSSAPVRSSSGGSPSLGVMLSPKGEPVIQKGFNIPASAPPRASYLGDGEDAVRTTAAPMAIPRPPGGQSQGGGGGSWQGATGHLVQPSPPLAGIPFGMSPPQGMQGGGGESSSGTGEERLLCSGFLTPYDTAQSSTLGGSTASGGGDGPGGEAKAKGDGVGGGRRTREDELDWGGGFSGGMLDPVFEPPLAAEAMEDAGRAIGDFVRYCSNAPRLQLFASSGLTTSAMLEELERMREIGAQLRRVPS